ncbi:MAG TPA: double-strand break repair protein AddB [Caulobacteraceae bacterium]|jgi:ATP-dependent helicase/nuclease subunit B
MTAILEGPPPRWFTIAAHRPFLNDLAAGLWSALSPLGPEALSDAMVLLPNRRTVRGLTEAFVGHAGGGGLLLPQMRALGDLDEGESPFEPGDLALELPPAIGAERRRFELAGLIAAHAHLLEASTIDAFGALDYADALGALLDTLQIEEVAWPESSLELAPPDMAAHWAVSARFLDATLAAWDERLAELGVMDLSAQRVAVTRRLIELWQTAPPPGVIVAAGSTGSTKATADLLATIARAPKGLVVLPGLDRSLAGAAWEQIDDQHPQGALARLLKRAGVDRGEVRPWDPAAETEVAGRWRRRLINEALRPPEATADWLEVIDDLRREAPAGVDPIAAGLEGLTVVAARAEEETAAVAAILLREALETPGRTAALVTPDTGLARRVQARLSRWGVRPDSSVGDSLAGAPAGGLAGLAAGAAEDPLDSVILLAIAKHPLTRLGFDDGDRERACETLERWGLRIRIPRDWSDIESWLEAAQNDARLSDSQTSAAILLLRRLRHALALLSTDGGETAEVRTRGLVSALEALAEDANDASDLWRGAAGEALSRLLTSLLHESETLPPMSASAFADLLDGLLSRTPLRRGGATHPRLSILGVLEARLVSPDLTILAGLEEGVWPSATPGDPFLSRPMRASLGLPPPERRIGLAAHDFAQAAAAPEVVLLHTQTRAGAPSVKSRWLWRLEALVKGAGLVLPERDEALDWARRLDATLEAPPLSLTGAPRPAPRPPVDVRPRKLSVTRVERWVRDPYSIYAQYVLGLTPIDRPGQEPDARVRGTAIHAAFEKFSRDFPGALPADGERIFADRLVAELRSAGMTEAQLVREQALAANAARWAMGFEARRREGAVIHVEQKGRMTVGAGAFELTARADRIEVRGETADILDFKTGAAPSAKQVKAFLAPQLTLTAAILEAGGFAEVGARTPGELLYVRVRGGRTAGEELRRDKGDAPLLAGDALCRLETMVEAYGRDSQPYVSWAIPQFIGKFGGDYDHLARLWEWAVVGEGGDDVGGEAGGESDQGTDE